MNLKSVVELKKAIISNDGVTALKDVNFELAEAEICYIIGQSGSGKSSLLKTLYGEVSFEGELGMVAGHDLKKVSQKDIPMLRRDIGMVFQDFNLFDNWTVRANLEYVLKATEWKNQNEIQARVQEVLQSVDLLEKLDVNVKQLSGGEQQRVVIARAILNKPAVIVADEPTGNLDPDTSDSILRLLYQIAEQHKTAILFATHDYRIVEKFQARVFKCEDGKFFEVE